MLVGFPIITEEQAKERSFKIHAVLTGVHAFTFVMSYYPRYMTIRITIQ